jgi:phage replication O-like protein O
MSLFRSLNEASLNANLNKNEAKVFSALMNQTIGYGKTFDHLTDKRLAQLTKIRLDRLYVAIEGVVEKDLFEVEESTYYDYRYQIAEKFIEKHPVFFTPHLPKKRMDFRSSETISYFQNDAPKIGHIHNNTLTSFNLTSIQPQQQPVEKRQAVRSPSTEIDVVVDGGDKMKPPATKIDVVDDEGSEVRSVTTKIHVDEGKDKVRSATTKINVVDGGDEVNVDLPDMIDKKDYATCHKALNRLTFGQQKRVLKTFDIKKENEVISNPVGLLIILSRIEGKGRLIVPKTQNHPSHRPFKKPVERSTNSEGKLKLDDHYGKLDWLRRHAKSNNESMTVFAEKMLMSPYLDDPSVIRVWLTFHAKREQTSFQALADTLALSEVVNS